MYNKHDLEDREAMIVARWFVVMCAMTNLSCVDPHSPEYINPHDAHSVLYKPQAPSGLTATLILEERRHLVWRDSSRAEAGFRIERTLEKDSVPDVIAFLPPNTESYEDTTVIATDTTYTYRLVAISADGIESSVESTLVEIPFAPPADLHMTCLSATTIKLGWKDSSSFETGYQVWESADFGPFTLRASLPPNSTSYTALNMQDQQTYRFGVKAVTSHNASAYSNGMQTSYVTDATELLHVLPVSMYSQCLAFSPDGTMLASGGENRIDVYRVGDRKHLATLPHAYNFPVQDVKFSPDGSVIASVHGGMVYLWDVATFTRITDFSRYGTNELTALDYTSTGDTIIAVGSWTQVWRPSDGVMLAEYYPGSSEGALDISPNGQYIAIGDAMLLLQLPSFGMVRSYNTTEFLKCIKFHPSGNMIATVGANDYRIQLWSTFDSTLIREMQESYYVRDLSFDPSGNRIAAAGRVDGIVNIWDTQTGSIVHTLTTGTTTRSVAFSPLNNLIAVGDFSSLSDYSTGIVRVWAFAGTWKTILP